MLASIAVAQQPPCLQSASATRPLVPVPMVLKTVFSGARMSEKVSMSFHGGPGTDSQVADAAGFAACSGLTPLRI